MNEVEYKNLKQIYFLKCRELIDIERILNEYEAINSSEKEVEDEIQNKESIENISDEE